jgi:RNA polymerase subunit RPABC4/transcription elongation factor Spt4
MRSMRYKEGKTAIIIDHVGNYLRYGLPDDKREWTLEQKKNRKEKPKVTVRTCPNCFAVVPATTQVCPNCGLRFRTEQEEPLVLESVQLHEISALPYSDYKKCKTFEELERFRKAKGFKPGWTYYCAKELHIQIPAKYSRRTGKRRTG